MKKLFILMLFAFVAFATTNAQQYIYPAPSSIAWDDTIQADTNYYPAVNGIIVKSTTGSVSFTFTKKDVTDSLSYARIEWSDDLITWTATTGTGALTATTTDGQSKVYLSTPLTALYYRVALACAAGDAVKITDPTLMFKDK